MSSKNCVRLRPGNHIGLNIRAQLRIYLSLKGSKCLRGYRIVHPLCWSNRKTYMDYIGIRDGVSELKILSHDNGLLVAIVNQNRYIRRDDTAPWNEHGNFPTRVIADDRNRFHPSSGAGRRRRRRRDNLSCNSSAFPVCGRPPPRKVFCSALIRSLAFICPASHEGGPCQAPLHVILRAPFAEDCFVRPRQSSHLAGFSLQTSHPAELGPTTVPHSGRESSTRMAPLCVDGTHAPGRTTATPPWTRLPELTYASGPILQAVRTPAS
jgi:hypothetical protein